MTDERAKVLIVDDDAKTRDGLAQLLEAPGQDVITAASGTDALRRCLQTDFAVILLDVHMPGMDGYETAESIHARQRSSCTPIIFLTGSEPNLDRLRGYEVGAVDFLLKPIEPLVLRSKVRVFAELWQRRREVERTQQQLRELEAREARKQAEEEAASELRRRDAELRAVLERQAMIFRSVPVALFTRSQEDPTRVVWTSENVERVLGFPSEAFQENPDLWCDRLHPEDRVGILRALAEVSDQEGASCYRWRSADGSWRWILEHVTLSGDDTPSLHGTWVDIQEQKRMEEALRESNSALDQRVAERTAELAAAVEELESFSYSVSHDLRAPLRSIHAYGHILADEIGPSLSVEGQHARDRLGAAVGRMSDLIDDLLRLSSVARARLEREPVDVTALAREIGGALHHQHPEREVDFHVQPELMVAADRGLLQIALENLLENAWKFTGPVRPARVEVGVQPGTPGALFVRDNGVGFDMRYASQLFRPFHRLHSQDQFDGTGIGLATVRRIVQRHGGDVWPESSPGEGTTFYFTMAPDPGGRGFRP